MEQVLYGRSISCRKKSNKSIRTVKAAPALRDGKKKKKKTKYDAPLKPFNNKHGLTSLFGD